MVSLVSASRMIIESWKKPKVVWPTSAAILILIGSIIIYLSTPTNPADPKPDKTDNRAFAIVSAGSMMVRPPEKLGLFFILHPSFHVEQPYHLVGTPIPFMLYVQLTNLRKIPMMIAWYSVESKTTNGDWVTMPMLDTTFGTLCFISLDHRIVKPCEITTFQSVLNGKQINPYETVQGWAFLDFPTNGLGSDYRFHIRDTTDAEFTKRLDVHPTNRLTTIAQSPGIFVTTNLIDVSKLPFDFGDGKEVLLSY